MAGRAKTFLPRGTRIVVSSWGFLSDWSLRGQKEAPIWGPVGANSALAMLPLDYVEFFVFLTALCLVGFFSGRGERKSSTDYFLAGRRLPWYAVGGSYVA